MAESLAVFVVGAGRMGEILATAMNRDHNVTVYDVDAAKGRAVAEKIGCRFGLPAVSLPATQAVCLALPPAASVAGLAAISPYLQPETVVINIATGVMKDDLRPVLGASRHLVAAKIVGQHREMAERPAILVDADTERGLQVASLLFSSLGSVQPGDERLVQMINTITARETLAAALRIEEALKAKGVAPELIDSALRVVAPGCFKAYAARDIGPWGLHVLDEVRASLGRSGNG
ncbi:MAG: NAD(P)-binding domain-containing protein [Chloroflexota bacterium]|nr:NAD(P)-binding domain-containing protein [Chloroflexota bacterium]